MPTFKIDPAHSEIGFLVRHMMFAKVRGQFRAWSAQLTYDPANPSSSKVEVEIDTSSIDTHEPKRDEHLRSAEFFESDKYPKMSFTSKRVETLAEGKYRLSGDLTIRDATREVTLEVQRTGTGKDPWGNQRLGFSVKGEISRSEWGLRWNQALETGGVLVSDKVELEIELQVVQSG